MYNVINSQTTFMYNAYVYKTDQDSFSSQKLLKIVTLFVLATV